ncbi:MAG: redoxin domain-containing protein [Burkholderiaceae bacterium]
MHPHELPVLGPAPPIEAAAWLNTDAPIALDGLRGRIVLLHAFQMLCPGCVLHGVPQAQRAARLARDDLVVLGLHSVFEHHDAMTPAALAAFAHEFGLRFPIAIDAHRGGDPVPATMRAYALQGTPSTVLVDRGGRVRLSRFGALDDLELGVALGALLAEPH